MPHRSTAAEITSPDAGRRSGGRPARNVLHMVTGAFDPPRTRTRRRHNKIEKKSLTREDQKTENVDVVTPSAHISSQRASLVIFEDNDAVIKMIVVRCGWGPTMRHASQTRRDDPDGLFVTGFTWTQDPDQVVNTTKESFTLEMTMMTIILKRRSPTSVRNLAPRT